MFRWIVFGLVFSLAPIWRGAGHPRTSGVSLWQLAQDTFKGTGDDQFGHEHLKYEDAILQAQIAFQERFK